MQYTEIFKVVKNENFQRKFPNKDCGYTLEPPRSGGSNEYPQSMFWSKNKKNRYTPANPIFSYIKSGVQGGILFMEHLPGTETNDNQMSSNVHNIAALKTRDASK